MIFLGYDSEEKAPAARSVEDTIFLIDSAKNLKAVSAWIAKKAPNDSFPGRKHEERARF